MDNSESKQQEQEQKNPSAPISLPAIKVSVEIENIELQMELDMGAAASIVGFADYERYFKHLTLKAVDKFFHAYTGTPLDIAVQILLNVTVISSNSDKSHLNYIENFTENFKYIFSRRFPFLVCACAYHTRV